MYLQRKQWFGKIICDFMFEIIINFLIHNSFIFHHGKINEGFNCIIFIVVKISVSPSLDKNDKHNTSFTFSKIESINVRNIIDKKKNIRKCVAEFCA